jgi:hypothetical protein
MTDSTFGHKGYFGGFASGDDAENGSEPPRKMSRIGSIPNKATSPDSENPESYLDAQRNSEAGNDIQYRTCSWQKVRLKFPCVDHLRRLCTPVFCSPD